MGDVELGRSSVGPNYVARCNDAAHGQIPSRAIGKKSPAGEGSACTVSSNVVGKYVRRVSVYGMYCRMPFGVCAQHRPWQQAVNNLVRMEPPLSPALPRLPDLRRHLFLVAFRCPLDFLSSIKQVAVICSL